MIFSVVYYMSLTNQEEELLSELQQLERFFMGYGENDIFSENAVAGLRKLANALENDEKNVGALSNDISNFLAQVNQKGSIESSDLEMIERIREESEELSEHFEMVLRLRENDSEVQSAFQTLEHLQEVEDVSEKIENVSEKMEQIESQNG